MSRARNLCKGIGIYAIAIALSGCSCNVQMLDAVKNSESHTVPAPTACTPGEFCEEPSTLKMAGQGYGLPSLLGYQAHGDIFLVGGTPIINQLLVKAGESDIGMIGFSPDGEWFAYYVGSISKGNSYKLHLISASGDEITTIPERKSVSTQDNSLAGSWGEAHWITSEYIGVKVFDPDAIHTNKMVFGILNVFSGKWNEIVLKNLPDHDPTPHYPGTWAFSSDFKRVLYVSLQRQDDGSADVSLVLWDIDNQVELWRDAQFFDSSFAFGYQDAAWSPDGAMLAFGGAEHLGDPAVRQLDQQGVYLLDRDGARLRLITNFLPTYETFTSYGFSWSLDGRYLAFMVLGRVSSDKEVTDRLYLYDTVTTQVMLLCQRQVASGRWHDGPVWSPDGRYLAYADSKLAPPDGEMRLLRVIDLCTGETLILAEDISFIGGWSNGW
jgi:dipeptidyl aminopeptidase/acylaminoacyl peptidase